MTDTEKNSYVPYAWECYMIQGIYYLDLQEENQIPLGALHKIKHSESAFCMHTCVCSKIMGVNYFWSVLQVNGPVGRYGG